MSRQRRGKVKETWPLEKGGLRVIVWINNNGQRVRVSLAEVSINGPSGKQDKIVDVTGMVDFTDLDPGSYSIAVTPTGKYQDYKVKTNHKSLAVSNGDNYSIADFELLALGKLRIKVIDVDTSDIINSMSISIMGEVTKQFNSSSGEWNNPGKLPVGSYEISLGIPVGTYDPIDAQNKTVRAGEVTDVIFRLKRLSYFEFRILDDKTGDIIRNAQVKIKTPDDVTHQLITDGNGGVKVKFPYHTPGNCEVVEITLPNNEKRVFVSVDES